MSVLPLKTLAVLEDNISAEETRECGGGVEQDREVRMWGEYKSMSQLSCDVTVLWSVDTLQA